MSVFGTLASLGGGAFMGIVMFTSMMAEAPACREDWAVHALQLVGWGVFAGGFGSLVNLAYLAVERILMALRTAGFAARRDGAADAVL